MASNTPLICQWMAFDTVSNVRGLFFLFSIPKLRNFRRVAESLETWIKNHVFLPYISEQWHYKEDDTVRMNGKKGAGRRQLCTIKCAPAGWGIVLLTSCFRPQFPNSLCSLTKVPEVNFAKNSGNTGAFKNESKSCIHWKLILLQC